MTNYNQKSVGIRLKALREQNRKSQEEIAAYLKIPRPSVSQIERGKRLLLVKELVSLSELYLVPTDEILFPEKKKTNQVARVGINHIKTKRKKVKFEKEKYKEILIYIFSKVGARFDVSRQDIFNILYLADFNYFERYEEVMTGETYIKHNFGIRPANFDDVLYELMGKDICFGKVKDKEAILPLRLPDLRKINGAEKEVIDKVLERNNFFINSDVPVAESKDGELIDYQLVFYRDSSYSVGTFNN